MFISVMSADARCEPPPDAALAGAEVSNEVIERARGGRVIAPVYVNGQGPFRFIVDTGANRSALSRRLAQHLGLAPGETLEVHSIDSVDLAAFTDVASLSHGSLALENVQLPILGGEVLAGEEGLLGVDGMRGRLLRMNFEEGCIEISHAKSARRLRGDWATVKGELRFGHLMLADGAVRNVPIRVLIDTGSEVSLGNVALRTALEGARGRRTDISMYTAGDLLVLERAVAIPAIRMGEIDVTDVLAYIGDYHIFDVWGLRDEPTLLIGMDVMRQTAEVAIDYDRALLHFRPVQPRRRGFGVDLSGGGD